MIDTLLIICALSATLFAFFGFLQRYNSFFGTGKDASNWFFLAAFFDTGQGLILFFKHHLLAGLLFNLFLAGLWVFVGVVRRMQEKPKE